MARWRWSEGDSCYELFPKGRKEDRKGVHQGGTGGQA
nr:MAG TPA: hypothetical protein [Bacteriophage sp.]